MISRSSILLTVTCQFDLEEKSGISYKYQVPEEKGKEKTICASVPPLLYLELANDAKSYFPRFIPLCCFGEGTRVPVQPVRSCQFGRCDAKCDPS